MPIDDTDQTFAHIQVVDNDHFNYVVYVRLDTEPFNFVPKIIYHCVKVNSEWQIDTVEYL